MVDAGLSSRGIAVKRKMKDIDQHGNNFVFVFIKLISFQILPDFFTESRV